MRADLASDTLLVCAPDPVQCFAAANYEQLQQFHLSDGAGLVLVDWLSSGRSARGERWAFSRYHSRNEVFVSGRRVFTDSLLLDPADGAIDAGNRMGRFNALALVLLVGAPLQKASKEMCDWIASQPISRQAPLLVSGSPLSNGAILRIAGVSVEQVAREIARHVSFVRELLHDDPWARKW